MTEITRIPTRDIEAVARPWERAEDTTALLDRIGDAQYVLLGESSHGTHEFYTWRSLITQRLVAEKGFTFIAVEGDWPDCYQLNRYIKHYPGAGNSAHDVLYAYKRWPAWMWANWEIVELAEWLRKYNKDRPLLERVGFYGLDIYSLWDSIRSVIRYLKNTNPGLARQAQQAYDCFAPYNGDVNRYSYESSFISNECEDAVRHIQRLVSDVVPIAADDYESALDVEQNAQVVVSAERYYRTMGKGDATSWNVRDTHMTETLRNLMQHFGPNAKAIIWAHNTHVGDARYTDMVNNGMVNIGQLIREQQPDDNTVLIGFGSYQGTVIAGRYWDEPMQVMNVPPAREGSWEHLMHQAYPKNKLIISDDVTDYDSFWQTRDHRAIGVVYNPLRERANYVPTLLPQRYDAFVFIDRTNALQPLHAGVGKDSDVPETYPWTT